MPVAQRFTGATEASHWRPVECEPAGARRDRARPIRPSQRAKPGKTRQDQGVSFVWLWVLHSNQRADTRPRGQRTCCLRRGLARAGLIEQASGEGGVRRRRHRCAGKRLFIRPACETRPQVSLDTHPLLFHPPTLPFCPLEPRPPILSTASSFRSPASGAPCEWGAHVLETDGICCP